MSNYILDGKKTAPEPDLIKWGKFMDNVASRVVDKTVIDGVKVSTVFLGIDHAWDGGEPVLFETMVFGGEMDQEMVRYSTWELAELGHNKMIELVLHLTTKAKED